MADDEWDPLADPEGRSALKAQGEVRELSPKLAKLRPDELRAFERARAGQSLRQVEIDRLVALGVARRGPGGELQLIES